jgi:hypothetical protein
LGHEAQNGEDDKSGHKTGGTVQEAEGDGVPVGVGECRQRWIGKERRREKELIRGGKSKRQESKKRKKTSAWKRERENGEKDKVAERQTSGVQGREGKVSEKGRRGRKKVSWKRNPVSF